MRITIEPETDRDGCGRKLDPPCPAQLLIEYGDYHEYECRLPLKELAEALAPLLKGIAV